jgi:uncharacterized membrane protein YdjX (TVP38/TMEM64 family)
MKTKKWLLALIAVAVLAVAAYLVYLIIIDLLPLVREIIADRSDEQKAVDYLRAYGLRGIPILVALTALLAMTGIVSADPVHILAGLCYGVLIGSLVAIVGTFIGNAAVFLLFRQSRKLFGGLVKPKERKVFSLKKLEKMKHPEIVAILVYLVPGVPNLVVPYAFSKLKISFWRYMACITLASLPGIIALTFTGNLLAHGNWEVVLVIVAALLIVAGILFANRKKIMKTVE